MGFTVLWSGFWDLGLGFGGSRVQSLRYGGHSGLRSGFDRRPHNGQTQHGPKTPSLAILGGPRK